MESSGSKRDRKDGLVCGGSGSDGDNSLGGTRWGEERRGERRDEIKKIENELEMKQKQKGRTEMMNKDEGQRKM